MIYTTVARILDSTQVVLAAGTNKGVQEGMEFVIYDLSEPILDPETSESLGQLELVKGRVRVTHVQEKLATATTRSRAITRFVDPLEYLKISATWFAPKKIEKTQYEEMRVDGAVAVQRDLIVRVGDRVRSVE